MSSGEWEEAGFPTGKRFPAVAEMECIWARCSLETLITFNERAACTLVDEFIKVKKRHEEPIVLLRQLIDDFKDEVDVRAVLNSLDPDSIGARRFLRKLEMVIDKAKLGQRLPAVGDQNYALLDLRQTLGTMRREVREAYPPERIISMVLHGKDIGVVVRIPGRPSLRELTADALADEMSEMNAQEMQTKFNFNVDLTEKFIFGQRITDMHRLELQMLISKMVGQKMRPRELPQPQVIALTNIDDILNRRDFSVSWLSAGFQRCLMLLKEDSCFIVNTDLDMRRVDVDFPRDASKKNTLVAAELVIDNISVQKDARLFISDVYYLNGRCLLNLSFEERCELLDDRIIRPYRLLLRRLNHRQRAPFKISRKYFWPVGDIDSMMGSFLPTLKHNTDGLLFRKSTARGLSDEFQFRVTR